MFVPWKGMAKDMKKALLISCFDAWYKKRLEPIRDILITKGYHVNVIVSDFEHVEHKKIQFKNADCIYIHVPPYKKNISLRRIRSHLFFGTQVKKYIEHYQPDFLYLVIPPNNTALHCGRYKKTHPKCCFIIDIIDLWPESMPLEKIKRTPPAWIWRNMRNNGIELADLIFLECARYRKELSYELVNKRSLVLYLFKDQSEKERCLIQKYIESAEREKSVIKLAYLGSINNIIDTDGICKVINHIKRNGKDVQLHIIGDGENRDRLIHSVEGTGCEVIYHGIVYDEIEKIKILVSCSFGLNMMKKDVSVGLTIKSIDYFAYGLPLINNLKGDTWSLIKKMGIGINYDGSCKDAVFKCIEELTTQEVKNKVLNVYDTYFTREHYIKEVKRCFDVYDICCNGRI